MSDANKKPLTASGKLYKLEIKQEAIVCPACRQKIRGVRLLPGAVLRNVSVMCQRCLQPAPLIAPVEGRLMARAF